MDAGACAGVIIAAFRAKCVKAQRQFALRPSASVSLLDAVNCQLTPLR